MGWWDTFTWSAKGVGGIAYRGVKGIFGQVAALPQVGYSVVTHAGTQQIAKDVLRITIEDLLPIIAATYVNNTIQAYGKEYLQGSPNWVSVDTLLQMGLGVMDTATWVYTFRRKKEMEARTVVLVIESSTMLPGASPYPPMTLCQEQKCTVLRKVKGAARDVVAYWATKPMISALRYLPYADNPIVAATISLFEVYFNGRLIMTVALPDLCNRHQMEYLKEYSALALSLGLGYEAMSMLALFSLEQMGVSLEYATPALRQFLLFASFSIASHMCLPQPVASSSQPIPEPVDLYQRGIGFGFDVVADGLKKQLPPLLRNRSSQIPWNRIFDGAEKLWDHPCAKVVESIVLPKMLQSEKGFIRDGVVGPHWEGFRATLIGGIQSVEQEVRSRKVQIAATIPTVTSYVVKGWVGIPVPLTRLVLGLAANSEFLEKLTTTRLRLTGMHSTPASAVTVDTSALDLRDDTVVLSKQPETSPSEPSFPVASIISSQAPSQPFSPEAIFRPSNDAALPPAAVFRLASNSALSPAAVFRPSNDSGLSPGALLRPSNGPSVAMLRKQGMFKNSSNLVRRGPATGQTSVICTGQAAHVQDTTKSEEPAFN